MRALFIYFLVPAAEGTTKAPLYNFKPVHDKVTKIIKNKLKRYQFGTNFSPVIEYEIKFVKMQFLVKSISL